MPRRCGCPTRRQAVRPAGRAGAARRRARTTSPASSPTSSTTPSDQRHRSSAAQRPATAQPARRGLDTPAGRAAGDRAAAGADEPTPTAAAATASEPARDAARPALLVASSLAVLVLLVAGGVVGDLVVLAAPVLRRRHRRQHRRRLPRASTARSLGIDLVAPSSSTPTSPARRASGVRARAQVSDGIGAEQPTRRRAHRRASCCHPRPADRQPPTPTATRSAASRHHDRVTPPRRHLHRRVAMHGELAS